MVLLLSYFVGIFSYIIFILELDFPDFFESTTGKYFFIEYGFDKLSDIQRCITMTYFAVTTLTTVGFGDFYPVNDTERILWIFVLLGGGMTFSFIMGSFLEVLYGYRLVVAENEDSYNLARFFGLLKRYNSGKSVKKEIVEDIENYFSYYWSCDKISFL
jgi:hypothetical protein